MKRKKLTTAEDLDLLVYEFYGRVLKDEELAYFFKEAIPNWEFHRKRIVSFWASQIFFTDEYQESPLHRHIQVDQQFERGFEKKHFTQWVNLWTETVDELFEGEKAELAKEVGINTAKNIFLKMFVNRSV